MPPGTTLRNVRINEQLWSDVNDKAQAENTNASEVIRTLLTAWVAGDIEISS